ncbi:MAG TPA: hypothetical protein VKT33_12260 [Candidatus Angelobacter sp.]|nr:hypothetical protein [Candidatus Angelobacter sp.]
MLNMEKIALIPLFVFFVVLSGCGGSSNSSSNGATPFMIASGNWSIPLPGSGTPLGGAPLAGGSLIQTGSTISGILHINGSPCFDQLADQLIVTGTASTDGSNTVTLSTAPIRGQVLTMNGKFPAVLLNHQFTPNGPQGSLDATVTITGGACAGQVTTEMELFNFSNANATATWLLDQGTHGTANLTQGVPDATGTSHFSGSFTFINTPCFTSGTVSNGVLLGNIVQATITTDTGQVALGGSFFVLGPFTLDANFPQLDATLVVTGGPCNGQTLQFNIREQ